MEAVEVLLFDNNNYKVSDSMGLNDSHMRRIAFIFDTGAGTDLVRADVLDRSWRAISAFSTCRESETLPT